MPSMEPLVEEAVVPAPMICKSLHVLGKGLHGALLPLPLSGFKSWRTLDQKGASEGAQDEFVSAPGRERGGCRTCVPGHIDRRRPARRADQARPGSPAYWESREYQGDDGRLSEENTAGHGSLLCPVLLRA